MIFRAVPLLTVACVLFSATVIASAPPIPVSPVDLPPPIADVFTTWLPSASSVTFAPPVSVPLMAARVVLSGVMFKATDTLEDGEFSRIVAENGGDENAFTTADYTAYFQRVAADRLDLVMGLEADRMVNLAPGPDTVPFERDVVIEERRQRVGNSPDALFYEQMRAALYVNHPYGRPVIGPGHSR